MSDFTPHGPVYLKAGDIDLGETRDVRVTPTSHCENCGGPFARVRKGHLFCSARCQKWQARKRKKAGLPAKLFGIPVFITG